jgi:citrate lyase subunit beta/citryl-CoA lyase
MSVDHRLPHLRRTWLFGPGADAAAHDAMGQSGADVCIQDLEDFTPPGRRAEARALAPLLHERWRSAGIVTCVRINLLEDEGHEDLGAAIAARAAVIAYPKAASAEQMRALDDAISALESAHGIGPMTTEILPVCETALGVVAVREIAAASQRVRAALLGAEDLAADLCAERGPDAIELDHARRRFVLECRAARIEPVDAPYTFRDVEGAVRETGYARRLGYRCKSVVRPEHVAAINDALTPGREDMDRARRVIAAFEAARARGEDRALVDGLWVEVPAYRNAQRLLQRAEDLERTGAAAARPR